MGEPFKLHGTLTYLREENISFSLFTPKQNTTCHRVLKYAQSEFTYDIHCCVFLRIREVFSTIPCSNHSHKDSAISEEHIAYSCLQL